MCWSDFGTSWTERRKSRHRVRHASASMMIRRPCTSIRQQTPSTHRYASIRKRLLRRKQWTCSLLTSASSSWNLVTFFAILGALSGQSRLRRSVSTTWNDIVVKNLSDGSSLSTRCKRTLILSILTEKMSMCKRDMEKDDNMWLSRCARSSRGCRWPMLLKDICIMRLMVMDTYNHMARRMQNHMANHTRLTCNHTGRRMSRRLGNHMGRRIVRGRCRRLDRHSSTPSKGHTVIDNTRMSQWIVVTIETIPGEVRSSVLTLVRAPVFLSPRRYQWRLAIRMVQLYSFNKQLTYIILNVIIPHNLISFAQHFDISVWSLQVKSSFFGLKIDQSSLSRVKSVLLDSNLAPISCSRFR